jgi:CheY-like chemotaxis protein
MGTTNRINLRHGWATGVMRKLPVAPVHGECETAARNERNERFARTAKPLEMDSFYQRPGAHQGSVLNAFPSKNAMNPPLFDPANSPTKKVLIVDSQEMIRSLLCRMLKSWGLACHPAPNLMSAYRAALWDGPFDAVVCDYELADGNAYNLIALMREHGVTAPTVVPVGSCVAKTRHEAGVEYLAKPFDPIELREALERMLGVCLGKKADPTHGGARA